MTPQPKPVDLKALLDTIVKIAPSSPEYAKELLKEFQAYSSHLREMDRKALQAQIVVTYLGQVFGLIIGLTAIISGSLTAYHGSPLAGGFIGGGGVHRPRLGLRLGPTDPLSLVVRCLRIRFL